MTTPANETPGAFATAYQHWFGPATFLRCPYQPDGKDTGIGLVGVPHCGGNPAIVQQSGRVQRPGGCHGSGERECAGDCKMPRTWQPATSDNDRFI